MNSTNTNKQRRVRPIRFDRLYVGSMFRIFAEPSRGIRKSNDNTVYKKEAEAFSINTADPEQAIILYPEDLVEPLTRGKGVE